MKQVEIWARGRALVNAPVRPDDTVPGRCRQLLSAVILSPLRVTQRTAAIRTTRQNIKALVAFQTVTLCEGEAKK